MAEILVIATETVYGFRCFLRGVEIQNAVHIPGDMCTAFCIGSYLITPAFLRALKAPSLLIVRSPRVETGRTKILPSSATKIRRLWMFGYFRTMPVGLNLVARVRLEYPPAMIEPF